MKKNDPRMAANPASPPDSWSFAAHLAWIRVNHRVNALGVRRERCLCFVLSLAPASRFGSSSPSLRRSRLPVSVPFGAAIPFAVAPQLDYVIANLDLIPLRMNQGKRDKMCQRQLDLQQRLRKAGWRL